MKIWWGWAGLFLALGSSRGPGEQCGRVCQLGRWLLAAGREDERGPEWHPGKDSRSWLGSGRQSGQVGFLVLKCLAPRLPPGRCWKMEVQRVQSGQTQPGFRCPIQCSNSFDSINIQTLGVF